MFGKAARVRKVIKRKTVLNTREVARLLFKSPRTVRRYAQYGVVKAAGKLPGKGWQFVALVDLEVR